MITLDDVNIEAGCLQHLLLAEARTPSHPAYDFDEVRVSLMAMKLVLFNRKSLGKAHVFCSKGAQTIVDFICAPVTTSGCQAQQFAGFSLGANNRVAVDASIMTRIQDAISIANNAQDPRSTEFIRHLTEIVSVSKGQVPDPYQNIPGNINGTSVLKGAYGWKTAGSADPGGAYVRIPPSTPPLSYPNGSIQGIQFYTIMASVSFLNEEEFNQVASLAKPN